MNLLKPIWENKKFFRADLDFVVDDLLAGATTVEGEHEWIIGKVSCIHEPAGGTA